MRRSSKEHGDELQRMEEVEYATADESRSCEGSNEKPVCQEAATYFAYGEHSLGPSDNPGRPIRSQQAPRRLRDYVRAIQEETIERSPTVLETMEEDRKLTRVPGEEGFAAIS